MGVRGGFVGVRGGSHGVAWGRKGSPGVCCEPERDLGVAGGVDELAGVQRGELGHEVFVELGDGLLERGGHRGHALLHGTLGLGGLGGEDLARLLEVVFLDGVLRGDLDLVLVEQVVHLVHLRAAELHVARLLEDAVDVVAVVGEVAQRAWLLAQVAHALLVLLERGHAAVARHLQQQAAALVQRADGDRRERVLERLRVDVEVALDACGRAEA